MKLPLIVVGAGGHATVVADALLCAGEVLLGFTDSDPGKHGTALLGATVLGSDEVLEEMSPLAARLVNGIGSVQGEHLRRRVQTSLEDAGWQFPQVRHPASIVSRFAHVADGVHLLAASVIQARARIGRGVIVNTAAVVEHDVSIGAFAHIAPRAVVCGGAYLGEGVHIGAGAVIRQGVRLAPGTVVGAGAIVIRDTVEPTILVGNPAVPLRRAT